MEQGFKIHICEEECAMSGKGVTGNNRKALILFQGGATGPQQPPQKKMKALSWNGRGGLQASNSTVPVLFFRWLALEFVVDFIFLSETKLPVNEL